MGSIEQAMTESIRLDLVPVSGKTRVCSGEICLSGVSEGLGDP